MTNANEILLQKRILALWDAGKSTMDIARQVKLPECAVYNALAAAKGQIRILRLVPKPKHRRDHPL